MTRQGDRVYIGRFSYHGTGEIVTGGRNAFRGPRFFRPRPSPISRRPPPLPRRAPCRSRGSSSYECASGVRRQRTNR